MPHKISEDLEDIRVGISFPSFFLLKIRNLDWCLRIFPGELNLLIARADLLKLNKNVFQGVKEKSR